jgi:hypothetical protein
MMFAHVCEDVGEVNPAGVQRAAKGDRTANLAGDRGDLIPGGLHGVEDPLGMPLERGPVFGQGQRSHVPVEQDCAEILLQAGDGDRHRRLDDVDLTGGGSEAARLTASEEIIQVTDIHEAMLRPRKIINA